MINRNYDLVQSARNFNAIDSALSELGDDVILIKVNPTDIERSSREHGSDLKPYYKLFNELYSKSKIKNKVEVDYYGIDNLVDQLAHNIEK